jgi:ligand-binding sensor domain-containing protein/tRNA A-37 threonylcarbamoyl transferase component Bud32
VAAAIAWHAHAADARADGAPFDGRYELRAYGEDEGLEDLTIEALAQDRAGFLWVGTQDGVFRFDGVRFARIGRAEGLPSGRVYALHEGHDGAMYVGTRAGLARVEGMRATAPAGLPADLVPEEGIASGPDGTLFVAMGATLYAGDGARFEPLPRGDGEPDAPVTALHVDPEGALVYARGAHLFRRVGRGGPASPVPWGDVQVTEPIDATITDRDGRLWARSLGALFARERGARDFARRDTGLPTAVNAGRLALDGEGRVLVPTERGLASEEGGRWRLLGRREGLAGETTLSALVDREGSLWIGLAGDGLERRVGHGDFTTWGPAEGLSHSVVWSVARAADGALWVGTQSGLDRIDAEGHVRAWTAAGGAGGTTASTSTSTPGLAGDVVYGLATAPDGSVWAGSWPGGVTRFAPSGALLRYGAAGIAPGELRVHAMFVASDGGVWMGAATGAYKLAGPTFVLASPPGGPSAPAGAPARDNVLAFAEDGRHVVWGVGKYGLQRLTGPAPRRFRKSDGLRDDFVASVAVLPGDAGLLVGYREAEGADVVRVDGDRLVATRVDPDPRDASEKVLFVGVDAARGLWLGTSSGARVHRADGAVLRFDKADGLPTNDMDQNAFLADADGSVWLGTSRGLVHARPRAVEPPAPPIVITGAWAGDRPLDVAREAQLGPGERTLRVSWAGLTFAAPGKVRYRYRLRGLEDAWAHETDAREVRFPALGKGSYRFEVVAISAAGRESALPASLAVEVLPAWWERAWARVAGAVLVAAAIAGLARLRERRLRARARELEGLVQARTRELDARVGELARANAELAQSNARADRIFTALAEALPGTVLDGKYRLDERLGRGGFGVVYKGTHLAMQREVAIKIFRPAPGNDSADALERFRREARSASRIQHPNAVVVHDFGIAPRGEGGIAYMVMELLDGPSLQEARASGMLTFERALDTLARVCEGLDASHANGLVHRDVKPENVLLHRAPGGATVVKVVDFGIATQIEAQGDPASARLTKTDGLLGTPGYIAPERLAGEPYDGRADVYAVGVMAYELFAARAPYETRRQGIAAVLGGMSEPPPSLRSVDPTLPRDLDEIVLRALRRDPRERPTAIELARALDALRATLRESVLERAVKAGPVQEIEPTKPALAPEPAEGAKSDAAP